jgi:putative ABC transport system ATP-binding protein
VSAAVVIETEGLQRVFRMGQSEVRALRGVDLTVQAGEFVALMGASGSGKSTLLHLLGCLDTPSGGRYLLEGREVSRLSRRERARVRGRRIGFVFQTFNLLPRLSALDNVVLPLLYSPSKNKKIDPRRRAGEVLARLGLKQRASHLPNELSGGERQRVAIARALVVDPAIILADEPTGNLDSVTSTEIMHLLAALVKEEGRTILMVTHDLQVAGYAGRRLLMRDGQISEPAERSGA